MNDGAGLLLGEDSPAARATTGTGGGVVSRVQVTVVGVALPAGSVAVTTRVYVPSAKPVVSNVPVAGQVASANTVVPLGEVSRQVRVAVGHRR